MTVNAFISLLVASMVFSPTSVEEATKAKVLQLAVASLEQHFDMNAHQFEVTARWIPNSLLKVGPEGIISVSIKGNIEEYTRFQVMHETRNGRKTSEIQLHIQTSQRVVVARERIKSNEALLDEQFELQWMPVRLGRDRFLTDLSELRGKAIRRSLLPGQPIRVHEISSPIMVRPGEEVSMRFTKGNIQLGLKCESRQSGSKDEEVQIYCQETRKKYTAQVLGIGETLWVRTH